MIRDPGALYITYAQDPLFVSMEHLKHYLDPFYRLKNGGCYQVDYFLWKERVTWEENVGQFN